MNILYMGTSDFAVKCLESLCGAGLAPRAVVTQPDKPRGRGYGVSATPVKEYARSLGIDVYEPVTLRDGAAQDILDSVAPDLICVVAYGKILPKYVLDYPRLGCVNVHASLLPKYRGAAPINYALINGEKITGVTTMYMSEGLDEGDILMTDSTDIAEDDDFGTLHDRLALMGGRLLVKTAEGLRDGSLKPTPQSGPPSYAPRIDNAVRRIDFGKSARSIVNLIRGLSPAPCAYTTAGGRNVKIFGAKVCDIKSTAPYGTVEYTDKMLVSAADGTVQITRLQLEGRRQVSAEDFMRGNRIEKFE